MSLGILGSQVKRIGLAFGIVLLLSVPTWAATYRLTWQDVATGETSWRIERCLAVICTYAELSPAAAANATTYDDTTAADATNYKYRVRAAYAGGVYSVYSNEACRPTDCSPAAPTGVHITGQAIPPQILLVAQTATGDDSACTRFLDGAVAASGNGLSWATAWKAFGNVSWAAGMTLCISGGTTSQSYTGPLTVGASGTSNTNRITIKVGQTTGHNGTVLISGGILAGGRNYVTIDGEVSGNRRIDVAGNVDVSWNSWPIVRYLTIHGDTEGISASSGASGDARRAQFSYNYLYDIRQDAGINLTGRNLDQAGYDYIIIDHNDINLNCYAGENGGGPDGIQVHAGATIEYNTFRNTVGTVTGAQHMDFIQLMGAYTKIIGNTFIDGKDSNIDHDLSNGTGGQYERILNNVFVHRYGSASIRYYFGPRALVDVVIANNLFIDHTSSTNNNHAVFVGSGSASSLTDVYIQNNIIYNVGKTSAPVLINAGGGTQADWHFDYNLINAGPSGTTTVTLDGASYTQAHPRTAAPSFTAYVENDYTNSNYRLAASDTAAANQATDLSAYFTIDKDGVTRPIGAAWDIGPYERNP